MKRLSVWLVIACFSNVLFATESIKGVSNKQTTIEENIASQWGVDALNIPLAISNSLSSSNDNAESLGLLSSNEVLVSQTYNQQNEQWFTNQSQSIANQDNYNGGFNLLTEQQPTLNKVNATYVSGRFSAQTGINSQSDSHIDDESFYIQGAVNLVQGYDFTLSFTAKVEAMGENAISHFYGKPNVALNNSIYKGQAKNTTIGLVSTYSITKNWKLLGMISATNLDDKIENSPLINNNNVQTAIIGTSYSF